MYLKPAPITLIHDQDLYTRKLIILANDRTKLLKNYEHRIANTFQEKNSKTKSTLSLYYYFQS